MPNIPYDINVVDNWLCYSDHHGDVSQCCYYSHEDHYSDVVMSAMASQITSVSIVYSTVCSGADKKQQSSALLAFDRLIAHTKGQRKIFPFDDVIMCIIRCLWLIGRRSFCFMKTFSLSSTPLENLLEHFTICGFEMNIWLSYVCESFSCRSQPIKSHYRLFGTLTVRTIAVPPYIIPPYGNNP